MSVAVPVIVTEPVPPAAIVVDMLTPFAKNFPLAVPVIVTSPPAVLIGPFGIVTASLEKLVPFMVILPVPPAEVNPPIKTPKPEPRPPVQ